MARDLGAGGGVQAQGRPLPLPTHSPESGSQAEVGGGGGGGGRGRVGAGGIQGRSLQPQQLPTWRALGSEPGQARPLEGAWGPNADYPPCLPAQLHLQLLLLSTRPAVRPGAMAWWLSPHLASTRT